MTWERFQIVGGEARALKERPGFIGVDVNVLALLDGGQDRRRVRCRNRRWPARRRCSGLQRRRLLSGSNSPPPTAPLALQAAMSSSYMAWASARSLFDLDFSCYRASERRRPATKSFLHAVDGPEKEIDRGGASGGDQLPGPITSRNRNDFCNGLAVAVNAHHFTVLDCIEVVLDILSQFHDVCFLHAFHLEIEE